MASSHKRDVKSGRPRVGAVAAPIAFVATVATIAVGVTMSDADQNLMAVDTSQFSGSISDANDRGEVISRGSDRTRVQSGTTIKLAPTAADKAMRPAQVRAAIANADTERWTTAVLNLWTRPDEKAKKVGEIDSAEKVRVTGRKLNGRQEIVLKGQSRWVTAGYLDSEKPLASTGTGGTCSNGTSVPSGVSVHVRNVHRAVCARWPEIGSYGTLRGGGGDHGRGRAVDIMISGETGWAIANYLRANAGAFGISYIIYSQQIWSVERGGEGWRGMSDRGSATANHYDHVHVSTY